MKHIKLLIRGRVQGVAYRAHARRRALELGLSGFVENRTDGTVYAEIEGPADQVDEMVNWCWTGPPLAQVETIETQEGRPTQYRGFDIRR